MLVTEEQILAEYEARNRFDDEALCASVSRLTTDELICPVCTKLVQSRLTSLWARTIRYSSKYLLCAQKLKRLNPLYCAINRRN